MLCYSNLVDDNTSIHPCASTNVRIVLEHISSNFLQPGTHLYKWVKGSIVEEKHLPKVLSPLHTIRSVVLLFESRKMFLWATTLYLHNIFAIEDISNIFQHRTFRNPKLQDYNFFKHMHDAVYFVNLMEWDERE